MLWLNSQQEMVSGCCTYTLLFGLFLSIDMPFLDLTFALKDDHPPMSCFMCFFLFIPRATKLGFYWSHLQPCMCLLSRCLCAWCARNLSLASSLHSTAEHFAIRPGLLAHRELEFQESQFDCYGSEPRGRVSTARGCFVLQCPLEC